jgi:hypothetical protein
VVYPQNEILLSKKKEHVKTWTNSKNMPHGEKTDRSEFIRVEKPEVGKRI